MASRFVHDVLSLIIFGLPYDEVHARKDAFSQLAPGIIHRRVRHKKYQEYQKKWNMAASFSDKETRSIRRVLAWKGADVAEKFMASLSHDVQDRVWDYPEISAVERATVRLYWEALCVWLVLNPDLLKSWAGVDVIFGRVCRTVDGASIWQEEATLIGAYAALHNRAKFLLRRRTVLREALNWYGSTEGV
jgi:hypothetical protein